MDTGETLTHHKPDLALDFVPPVDWTNDPDSSKLNYFGIRMGLSIESVKLKFTHTRDRCSSVYGKIYMNDAQFFKAHTLYHRPTSDEAETMSEPSGGPLSLCGPKYFLRATSPTALYLLLHEVGKEEPLFWKRVPLKLGKDFPTKTISVEGEEATLTIRMTAISPSVLSTVSLELSSPRHSHSVGEWLVSGSVTAIQTINADSHGRKVEGKVSLFNRPDDRPLRSERGYDCCGQLKDMISLDRDVLLAPLFFDKDYIRRMAQLHIKYGYPDAGHDPKEDVCNGVGCYLSVLVDLRLVKSPGDKPFPFQGVCHYQFKSSHASGALFRATLKPVQVDEEIEVSVILEPSLGVMSNMEGEPYECDIDLYPPSDEEGMPSDSN